jgi:hypothetical protein
MERKFRTPKFITTHTGQIFTMPSETQPDQTMSIRTILENHTRGLPITGNDPKTAIWDDASNGIDPRTMDLVDIQNYYDSVEDMKQTYEKTKKRKLEENKKWADKVEAETPEGQ